MIRIVLTEEQTQALVGNNEPIDLVDAAGRMLGRVTPPPAADDASELSPEELAEIKRRMADAKAGKGRFYATEEVLAHLHSLEVK